MTHSQTTINLAYLYAEKGGNIDKALNLAQSAKQQVPDDPGGGSKK